MTLQKVDSYSKPAARADRHSASWLAGPGAEPSAGRKVGVYVCTFVHAHNSMDNDQGWETFQLDGKASTKKYHAIISMSNVWCISVWCGVLYFKDSPSSVM